MRKQKTFTTELVDNKYIHLLDCKGRVDVYVTDTRKTTRAAILKFGTQIKSIVHNPGERVIMIESPSGIEFEVEKP